MKDFFRKHLQLAWASLTFVLSMIGTPIFGRSMWCDEIIRLACQKYYTISQLIDCKHLRDFDSQSPIGYILLRPFQNLLGMEWGGYPFAALSAAIITFVAINLLKRWRDEKFPSPWLCAFIAMNPMLIWFGGELWFYQMFAAAFAVTFNILVIWDDPRPFKRQCLLTLALVISSYLTIALHFCGLFPYMLLAGTFLIWRWAKKGFADAFLMGALLAIPILLNLPIYLNAQYAAKHIAADSLHWMRLIDRVPEWLANHFIDHYPQLTGGSWLGVAASAWGLVVLFRKDARTASLVLAAIFGFWLFAAYSLMREFLMTVGRYWTYALAPTIAVAALGFSDAMSRRQKIGFVILLAAVLMNIIGNLNTLTLDGRVQPFRKYAKIVGAQGKPAALVVVNQYETRMFNLTGYLEKEHGSYCISPSYWEQGEKVRVQGLAMIRQLSPTSPVFMDNPDELGWSRQAGYTSTNIIYESRSPFFNLSRKLKVFAEPLYGEQTASFIMVPTEDELILAADRDNLSLVLPGNNLQLRQMPPREQTQPFTPIMVLKPYSTGSLRVRLPASATSTKATVTLQIGTDVPSSANLCGQSISIEKTFRQYAVTLDCGQPGRWQELPIKTSIGSMAILSYSASPAK